jgi:pimeloyl-ACP methyl ester carboxylesterase
MRRLLRIAQFGLLAASILFVVLLCTLLSWRAYRQRIAEEVISLRSASSVDEDMYVTAGGIEQWVQMRGQDRANPVLLCLHGGPGGSWIPQTMVLAQWEQEFTVVQWDQRGTGKTLEATGASITGSMTVEQMADDGIEVSEFVRNHLHKDKIVLLGFSWGSILGIHMIQKRPDLFFPMSEQAKSAICRRASR